MKKNTIGTLNSIIAAISYGTNPLFSLPMFSYGMNVNSVLFYRYLFASIIYFFWLKFHKKISLKISKKQFVVLFFLSIIFSMSSVTLFSAFNYIPSGLACTILFIFPIYVALVSFVFYKEKITKKLMFALLITIFGILQLYTGEVKLNLKGILLVLSSGLFYAVYMVLVKHLKTVKSLKTEVLSFYVMFFGLAVYIVNLKFLTQLQFFPNTLTFLFAIGLAIFPTIISLETIGIGIKLIGATKTAILGALEPLTALFFGILLFNEVLTLKILFGIILVLFGVNLAIFKSKTD